MTHVPKVRILTRSGKGGFIVGADRVYLDGLPFDAVIDYIVNGGINEAQTITLTFYADVVIEHADADIRGAT